MPHPFRYLLVSVMAVPFLLAGTGANDLLLAMAEKSVEFLETQKET